jgi:LytR cell envelope-related transcriptional attenuator
VDVPLRAPDAVIPWRNAALIAGAVAIVELLLLLVISGAAIAHALSGDDTRAATRKPRAAQTPAKPAKRHLQNAAPAIVRSRTRVLVLNGNGRQGAAASAAARVQRRGYRIVGVANASRTNFGRSIVMYRPGFAGEGLRLARDLGVRVVTPLDGLRVRELHGAHLVFILGA